MHKNGWLYCNMSNQKFSPAYKVFSLSHSFRKNFCRSPFGQYSTSNKGAFNPFVTQPIMETKFGWIPTVFMKCISW